MNKILAKKLKSGLKKCPIHKYGSNFDLVEGAWYRCNKCGGYQRVEAAVGDDTHVNIRRNTPKGRTVYSFKDFDAIKI